MRRLFIPVVIAAVLAPPSVGARAAEGNCDIVCRLQGYLSTDHMATAADGAAAAPALHAAKHHPRAATAQGAHAKPAAAAGAPKPAAATKAPVKSAKTAGQPKADTIATPEVAAATPNPPAKETSARHPSRHRAVATTAAKPSPVAEGTPGDVTPSRPKRSARAAQRVAKNRRPTAPVSAVALIPGSARLVPAEFQRFGL